jgi:hypothetical protein
MKIAGQITRAAIVGQADKYKRFAEQCRELAKPLGGQFKQMLDEMAQDWDDLACQEDKQAKSHEKAPAA